MNLKHLIIFSFLLVTENLSAQNKDIRNLFPGEFTSFDLIYCNRVDSFYKSDTIELNKLSSKEYPKCCEYVNFSFYLKDSCFVQAYNCNYKSHAQAAIIDALSFKIYTKKRKTHLMITSHKRMTTENFLVLTPKQIKSNDFQKIQTLKLLRVK